MIGKLSFLATRLVSHPDKCSNPDSSVPGLHGAPAHDDALSMTSILSASSQATTLDTWTPYRQEDKEIWTSHNKVEDRENENAFTTNTRQDDKEYSEQNSELMSSLPSYNEVRGR